MTDIDQIEDSQSGRKDKHYYCRLSMVVGMPDTDGCLDHRSNLPDTPIHMVHRQ